MSAADRKLSRNDKKTQSFKVQRVQSGKMPQVIKDIGADLVNYINLQG